MRKSGIFTVSLIAMMTVSATNAQIASKAYVDDRIDPVETKIDNHAANTDIHVTTAEKAAWDAKQAALGYTPEDVDNKETATTGYDTTSNTKYPTMAVVDTMITNSKADINNQITSLNNGLSGKQSKSTGNYQMGAAGGTWVTMTDAQQNALNSGATTANIGQIATNTADIATINASDPMTSGITAAKVSGYDALVTAAADMETQTHASATYQTINNSNVANGTYNTITAGNGVGANLVALDTGIGDINDKIGNVTSGKTVVEMIQDAQGEATYDDTALAGRVSANEDAIETLNGNASTSGSVANSIATALTDYTLKSVTANNGDGVVTAVTQTGDAVTSTKQKITTAHIADNAGILATQLASGVQTSLDKADNALPAATYNSQVGTVSASNMGTTATTVVGAIKEVHDSVAALDNTYASDSELSSELALKQDKSDSTAAAGNYIVAGTGVGANLGALDTQLKATTDTANAAIPKPGDDCENATSKCVLTYNNSVYTWEVIGR